MATSFSGEGMRMNYANATGSTITSGSVVRLVTGTSGYCGVAINDIANGASGPLEVEREHTLAKTVGQAFTVGQVLYWAPSTSKLSSTATGTSTRIGRCTEAAGSAATTAKVKLNA